jgi:hypothetical protein
MLKVSVAKNKDGTFRYYILRQDPNSKAWAKVPVAEIGFKFTSRAEAEEWIRKQKEFQETRRARMEKKQEWLNRNYDLVRLTNAFYEWHKTDAPGSVGNLVSAPQSYDMTVESSVYDTLESYVNS